MLIEQIIEFDLKVPRPLVVHIFLELVIFMTKIFMAKSSVEYYLMLNILQKAMYRAFPDLGQVTNKI